MSSRKLQRAIFFLLLLISTQGFGQTRWTPYLSTVSFKIKNAGFEVDGSFKGFKGDILFSEDALAGSSLSGSVQAATINTGNEKRDKHLKSEEYFDAGRYKSILIKSKKLYKTESGFAGIFDITIKDQTREVKIPFNFTVQGDNAIIEGGFSLNRLDFGVGGKSLILSEKVQVSIVVNTKK